MVAAHHQPPTQPDPDRRRQPDQWLAVGLIGLATGLAVNSLLGPLFWDIVAYPLSETLVAQTMGLEAVSLLIVAPWSVVAAVLALRGHPAGPTVAIPPAGYAAYMFLQYIVGPQYQAYPPVLPLHLGIFVTSGAVLVRAWTRSTVAALPARSERRERGFGAVLLLLAGFTVSRYLAAFRGVLTGGSIPGEYAGDPSMYWSIFLLDLGVVVPGTVAASVGLVRGATWARKALYGVVGWFVLVPISVTAMSITMVVTDDPNATPGDAVVLGIVALLFTAFAAWLYHPLFSTATVGTR